MEKREKTWIVAFLLLGVVGLWTFLNHYDRAIPVASLDFKVSREEAFDRAKAFAEAQGHDLAGLDHAQVFVPNMMGQIFLQKSLGLEESNRLARDWVSVYRWQVRWFRPLEKEEIHVHLDPGGRIVGYEHQILDEAEGARLEEQSALAIAEAFAFETIGFDRDDWTSVERSSESRTARTDHTFTYRKNGFTVGEDGHYRMQVVVQGDRVGMFDEYVHVPDTFERAFQETRGNANLLTGVFAVFWLALGVATLVILARRYRAGGLDWRSSTILGIAVFGALALAQLNAIPVTFYGYDTTESIGAFYVQIVMGVLLGSVLSGGIVAMTGTAGAWVTRDALGTSRLFPRLSLANLVSGRYVRATLVGYGFAGAMLGFLILFYYAGTELFGVWSPAYVIEYDNAFSTAFPWAFPLLVGLVAAAQEEFFFRLLAIPLLLKWVKVRWVAVLLPAIVWGFLHSNYPVEPIYTRGIELTIVGVAFGYLFLRWGIWSTIVAHYGYNAFVTAFPMLRSTSLYFQVSGIAVIGLLCVPVVFAAISAIRGRASAETDEEEEEEVDTSPTSTEPVQAGRSPEPPPPAVSVEPADFALSARQRLAAAVAVVGSLAILYFVEQPQLGKETLRVTVDRGRAEAMGDSVLAELGWSLADSRSYALYWDSLGNDHYAYLLQQVGVARSDSLVDAYLSPRQWRFRRFRPLEKTEYRVAFEPDGPLASIHRVLPDSLAGAELSSDDARAIAEAGLARHFGIDVSDSTTFRLIEATSEKKVARLDHDFVWERPGARVGEGEFRVNATVQGDAFGSAHTNFKAPEAWLRAFRERSTLESISRAVPAICLIVLVILAVRYFFQFYRDSRIAWRGPLAVGACLVGATLIEQINLLPTFFRGYDTSQSMTTFLGTKAVGTVTGLTLMPLLVVVVAALGTALWRDQVPDRPDFFAWFRWLRAGRERGVTVLEACLAGAAFSVVYSAVGRVRNVVAYEAFPDYRDSGTYSLPWMDHLLPAGDAVRTILVTVALIFAFLAVVLVLKRVLRTWLWTIAALFVLATVRQIGAGEDLAHGATLVGFVLLQGAVALGVVLYVFRFSLLAWFVSMSFVGLLVRGERLASSGMVWYEVNGYAVILIGLLPLLWGLFLLAIERRSLRS